MARAFTLSNDPVARLLNRRMSSFKTNSRIGSIVSTNSWYSGDR